MRDRIQNNRLNPIAQVSSLKRLGIFLHNEWTFFCTMNLEEEAHRAILNVRKVHFEIDLLDYQRAMKFAEPDMEAFDKLLVIIQDLVRKIKNIDKELRSI